MLILWAVTEADMSHSSSSCSPLQSTGGGHLLTGDSGPGPAASGGSSLTCRHSKLFEWGALNIIISIHWVGFSGRSAAAPPRAARFA